MKLEGTAKLKKVTPNGAVYALSIPGLQTQNLYVNLSPGQVPAAEGTAVVEIDVEEPKAAKEPEPPKNGKKK